MIKSQNGDFSRTNGVLENQKSQEAFLKGYRLKRLPRVRGIFERHVKKAGGVMEKTFYGPSSPGVNTEQILVTDSRTQVYSMCSKVYNSIPPIVGLCRAILIMSWI